MKYVILATAMSMIASPVTAQDNNRGYRVDHVYSSGVGTPSQDLPPRRRSAKLTPYEEIVAFGRCVASRDPAGALAFARAADNSATSRAVRALVEPVIAICNDEVAGPTLHGRTGLKLQRASIADALRERLRGDAGPSPS